MSTHRPATEAADRHISQSTAARARDRFERAEPADVDLTLQEIEQDEASRAPANLRKQRRMARARRVRAQRRFNRMTSRQLIAARLSTPAPSRGAVRLAARLQREAQQNQEHAA